MALEILVDGDDVPIDIGNRPTLQFSADLSTASGHTGCNSWNGSAALGPGTIEIDEIMQTLMGCQDGLLRQESRFLDFLARAESFEFDDVLTVQDGLGNQLTFGAGDPATVPVIADQEWELEAIQLGEGEPLLRAEFPASLTLRSAERRAVGSTGCNDYEIAFTVSPDDQLVLGEGIISAVGCVPAEIMLQEEALLSVLRGEVRVVLHGPKITVSNLDGRSAVFRRAS